MGMVMMDIRVLMATSSLALVESPPYFSAKRPRLVAVGMAWRRTIMAAISGGKLNSFMSAKAVRGPMVSWMAAVKNDFHFLMRARKLARLSIKPMQSKDIGVMMAAT